MLIVYRLSDGLIASNSGTNSLLPEGPLFEDEVQNAIRKLGGQPEDYGEFRLHDVEDVETVRAILNAEEYELEFDGDQPVGVIIIKEREPEAPAPDFQGFLLGAFQEIGHNRTRDVLREYPELNIAASRENATVLRNAFEQALADEFLSQQEYDMLQSLMEQYHIPAE